MSKREPQISWGDLDAYILGGLDEGTRQRIEAYLIDSPGLLEQLQQDNAIRSRLCEMFAPVLAESIPEHMLDILKGARFTVPRRKC